MLQGKLHNADKAGCLLLRRPRPPDRMARLLSNLRLDLARHQYESNANSVMARMRRLGQPAKQA